MNPILRAIAPGFLVLASCFSARAGEKGPTWLSLGAPFRDANSSTIINGNAGRKLPAYDEITPTVYQIADRDRLVKGVLSFVPRPRWFPAGGQGKPPEGISLSNQGCSLSLRVAALGEGLLRFDLGVKAEERDVFSEIEHRRNDITPFLFSLAVDGEVLEAPPEANGYFGGTRRMIVLAERGETATFDFKVDPRNILKLIGDRKFSELSIIAAFCERRQEDGGGGGVPEGFEDVPIIDEEVSFVGDDGELAPFKLRPILIRSNAVELGFADGKWSVKGGG